MVGRDRPEARATRLMPPRPRARASAAAYSRRCRSSRWGKSAATFSAKAGGIAYVTANSVGVPVRIKEADDAGAGRALKHVYGLFDERVKRRSLTSRDRERKTALVSATTDYSGFKTTCCKMPAWFGDRPRRSWTASAL